MKSEKRLAAIALSLAIVVSAWGQDSSPTAAQGEQTSAREEVAQRPLSGVQLRGNEDQVEPRGLLIPALTFSERTTWNGYGGDWQSVISGYLDYNQASAHRAFNLRYGGGGLLDSTDFARNTTFQNLSMSESFAVRRWTFTLGDILSYLPEAPVGGGIGIPGLGQYLPGLSISALNPTLLPSQSILTFNTASINNSSFGQVQYNFTRRTSVTTVGSYGLLRYPDNSTLDGHQMVFSTGLNHVFGRSQTAVQYSYSRFAYDSLDETTETHTAQLIYSRLLRQNFTAQVSAGPEIVLPHGMGTSSRVVAAGLAAIVYSKRRNHATLQYVRGMNGGSGLLRGAYANTIQLSAGHEYRLWKISFNGGYLCNSGVTQNAKSIQRSAGAQLTRSFGRMISGYLNYTYLGQGSSTPCNGSVCSFNGGEHVVGVGLSWHPRGLQIGELLTKVKRPKN